MASEQEIISVISQLISIDNPWEVNNGDANTEIMALIIQIIYMVDSMNLAWQPKQPKSELMLLITQTILLFNSMVMDDSQLEPLRKLISFITKKTSLDIDPLLEPELDLLQHFGKILSLEPEPEFISLIRQIVSLVISMDPKWKKLISLSPQVAVRLEKGKLQVDKEFLWGTNYKLCCFPLFWLKFRSTGEDKATHFFCRGCNGGNNHHENNKAPVEIKHPLHPKHSLRLALLQKSHEETRQCYCCDESLQELFYYCSACDYAMNIACVEKPPVFSIDHPKWHKHTLALFPRQTPFTCSMCALTHTTCPFYICPPCDFAVHQRCISLPRVIRISRHPDHRISFTHSFGQGDWSCGVCRKKIDNDYGGYSCIKEGCSYAAHSKCATQKNVWDGKDLEDIPEENDEEAEPPFVTISDGVIEHFSHRRHHLRLEENTDRDYDVNKLCQGCVMPIYIGNFYSCMKCDYILHETCANLSRKIRHPIHPHMLTLQRGSQGLLEHKVEPCSACPWKCKAGFFYECQEGGDEYSFSLHVQCATISEPLLHKSHRHSLFLTSKPGEKRRCSVCKNARKSLTNETFNCIECDYFALCFGCATLPQEVRYEHDEHMLTLSYGEETSTMTYWCEICEQKVNPKERFYTCGEYCCVTLHIECLLGRDLYMKPGSYWLNFYFDKMIYVRPNNHMTRRFCSSCKKRCPHKIVLESSNSIFCSTSCVRDFFSKEVDTSGIREFFQRRGYEDDEFSTM